MSGFMDRRRYPRRLKLIRFTLLWKRAEEQAFTMDASLGGVFVRTAVAPPQGARVMLLLPEARPTCECIRIEGTVVRVVRRGDPVNPLGGIAITLDRVLSPRGTQPVIELLKSLLGSKAPEIEVRQGSYIVELPAGQVRPADDPLPTEDDDFEYEFEPKPLKAEMIVFCRINNMVIQATLMKLGTDQAILGNVGVAPQIGDVVSVRMLSQSDTLFRGIEFTGQVDQIMTPQSVGNDPGVLISLAINPMSEQRDCGGLRSILKKLADTNESNDEDSGKKK